MGYENTDNVGDEAGQMGNNLNEVSLGTNFTPVTLECGYSHTCARGALGMKCWGRNNKGQLGYGDVVIAQVTWEII